MVNGNKILIVEDDAAFSQSLADVLSLHEGLVALTAENGEKALELVTNCNFEIILMDVGLPDIDGRDLCRAMRRLDVRNPIIMLTALDSDADTILGLDSGANDYITKPFRLSLFLARIRAQRRAFKLLDAAAFPIGPYFFRPSAKMMINAETEKEIHLTEKETAILKYLCGQSDRAIEREMLLQEVWGYNAGVDTRTLETHICRLRKKIEIDPTEAHILVTEPAGYRLVR